jgi:hypothetical protein
VSVGGYILANASSGELSHDNATLPVIDGDINPGGGIFVHWDNTNFLIPILVYMLVLVELRRIVLIRYSGMHHEGY